MRVCEIENGLRLDDIDSRTEDYPCPCDMGQKWVRERESYVLLDEGQTEREEDYKRVTRSKRT